ncbi:MAG: hypothetical protein E8D52_06400 [Nitrospira sp.]|nr:MAG: hypothetical protein E8D52_06400 [Nitrospira sp.]
MSLSKRLDQNPARTRVLLSGSEPSAGLQQQHCQRCAKAWWPRQPHTPVRCPGCKSPYWDKPRRLRQAATPSNESVNKEALGNSLGQTLTKAHEREDDHQRDHEDRSLAHALHMLKAMKAAGRTWQEMADRLEREFGTTLEKDQLKALVR